jgi:hypothetical protein
MRDKDRPATQFYIVRGATEYHARRKPPLLSRILLKIAVVLWCLTAFFVIGWLLGMRVAASDQHNLLMTCIWMFGIGCVCIVIAGLLDADQ